MRKKINLLGGWVTIFFRVLIQKALYMPCFRPKSHKSKALAVFTSIIEKCDICDYYSFKIFPRFWLVKTTRIIHYNQLLLTTFGKNFVILYQWREKCSPLQIIDPLTKKPGDEVVLLLVNRKNKELIFSFKTENILKK